MHACVCVCVRARVHMQFMLHVYQVAKNDAFFKNGKNEGIYRFDQTALMNIPKYVCILIYLSFLLLKLVLNRLPVFLD
jgi:hypothetical protein